MVEVFVGSFRFAIYDFFLGGEGVQPIIIIIVPPGQLRILGCIRHEN